MKNSVIIGLTIVILILFNLGIYQKEEIKAEGDIVFLELAPVDPRSLMQGDYMRLNYQINRAIDEDILTNQPNRGYLVITLDNQQIGHFTRLYAGEKLADNEKLLHFHNMLHRIRIVPDSFFFQEGHAKFYEEAKYGVFKFDDKGNHLLVGLALENLEVIQPYTH